jgi:hypothetical protein
MAKCRCHKNRTKSKNADEKRTSANKPYVGKCFAITSFVGTLGKTKIAQTTHALVTKPSMTRSTAIVPKPAEKVIPWRNLLTAGLAISPSLNGSIIIAKKPIQLRAMTSLSGSRLIGAIRKRHRLARKK